MSYFLNSIESINQFTKTTKEKYFVDKSGLIEKMNDLVGTASQHVCITRLRRFGKTLNAMMLASNSSKSADCKCIFDKLVISKEASYLEHLNKHNVFFIKFNVLPKEKSDYSEFIDKYRSLLIKDLLEICPNVEIFPEMALSDIFDQVYNKTGEGFIFVIDEWDYMFNNNLFSLDDRISFLRFLEDLLKDKSYVELAYTTRVLPIAKYSAGSAINMFL